MISVSAVQTDAPTRMLTPLQARVYECLQILHIPFTRVDTDVAISMDDCVAINERLGVDMVKTLFLCNRQKTRFYLCILPGSKAFRASDFSRALDVPRVSFAPSDLLESMLGTKIGAATVFGALQDVTGSVRIIFDQEVASAAWYGCSDGTTTSYLKLRTDDVLHRILPYADHSCTYVDLRA